MIPISEPDIGELEIKNVTDAVNSGWISSLGSYVDSFEKEFARYCSVKYSVSLSNGTDSLLITLKALGIGPGDEVIVPSLTFVAVPAVVVQLGATPVLVDVDPDYWCIDPAAIQHAITDQTKAIIAVHSYGHPADMDLILKIANHKDIPVIEDCAEAHGARYKGKIVGSIGIAGCFSFYGNKIMTTGEGGSVTTNNRELAERVRLLKDHAMDSKKRYYHAEVGYNCRMTNMQAALGCAQLQRIDELLGKRAQILRWYRSTLSGVPGIAAINPVMTWAEPVNWMTSIVLEDKLRPYRSKIEQSLRDNGIDTRPFFIPNHQLPPYEKYMAAGLSSTDSIADSLGASGLNLPSSPKLSKKQVDQVTSALKKSIESVIKSALQ